MKSDSQLQRDVMAELGWEPSVDHADIGVAVDDGVVTLSGFVKTYSEKLAAEKAAGPWPASRRLRRRSRCVLPPIPRRQTMKSPSGS